MTREEAEQFFDERLASSVGDEMATSSWVTLRFEALKYMDQGTDPDMVMFALKIAIEEQKDKGELDSL